MARLNEAPLPTESVDALKRRFVRQNRELAKNNSAQCLRIRALECEVSRLLGENLNLREEVVGLQAQLCDKRPQLDNSALVSIKDQLQAKLVEFGTLVSELGSLQDTSPSNDANKQSDPSAWRPMIPVAALSGQAPRMSEISEEFKSPGGTLRSDQTSAPRLSDQTNPSPDLGPPPVAHFECEDPIKFDPTPSEPDQPTSDNESIPANMSVNLETRRRRKDGQSRLQLRRSSLFPTDWDDDDQPLRTSAKRKLSVRDSDEPQETAPVKDDFKFSRRSSIAPDFKNDAQEDTPASEATDKPALRSERKVLGNKSVNTSPRKQLVGDKDGLKKEKDDVPKKPSLKSTERKRSRTSSARSVSLAIPEPDTVIKTVEIAPPIDEPETLPPKTPALEFLSPTPSQPSAARDEGRDTPPPSGLRSVSSGSAALNGASRPSRRARAAVNYAEPNLISKMRRPTTDFAPAVDKNGRRSSTNPSASSDKKVMRTVVVKEDQTRSGCSEPASPLGQKVDRENSKSHETTETSSASGRTIQALISGQRNSNEAPGIQDMDMYDLKDSSPAAETKKGRGSRRHSSVIEATESEASKHSPAATEATAPNEETKVSDAEQPQKAVKAGTNRTGRAERGTSRRRSMMV